MSERVLITAKDARGNAVAWRLKQESRGAVEIAVAGGNAGLDTLGKNTGIGLNDIERQVRWARDNQVTLAFISSEDQLALSAVDQFREAGILAFGPNKAALQIEEDKGVGVRFNNDHDISQPKYRYYPTPAAALLDLPNIPWNMAVKGAGLAGGKAVAVVGPNINLAKEHLQKLAQGEFSGAGKTGVVIQEQVTGFEISAQAVSDGKNVVSWLETTDHKKRFNEDHKSENPNTGGKGAIARVPRITEAERAWIHTNILEKAVRGLAEEGRFFTGALFAGLMVTESGIKVLEWNARFGDPEFSALIMLFKGNLLRMMKACSDPKNQLLTPEMVSFRDGHGVAVVYEALSDPGLPDSGRVIFGLDRRFNKNLQAFHARTRFENGYVITDGLGRTLTIAGFGPTLDQGINHTYKATRGIGYNGGHIRTDVGKLQIYR